MTVNLTARERDDLLMLIARQKNELSEALEQLRRIEMNTNRPQELSRQRMRKDLDVLISAENTLREAKE